ncbi:hypothetical protein N657DRAFT_630073 [Parathielavia appendiculata]|uniref:Uncharacterized protein n=1 Tax=Parathielavia appendiculata TaxID=2587402 RepID=A0AAN6Z7Z3_9PEZI|nr:hypothetical protein N657DRAFT_630073 [Parathielavia appendiculata]
MSPDIEVEEQLSRLPSLESCREKSEFDPPPPRKFAGLLLSCRPLYTEPTALLYSANRFVIFYSHHGSLRLKTLRAPSPTALASMTSLNIVLNESSCHQPTDSHNYPPSRYCCSVRKCADAPYCASNYHATMHRRLSLDLTVNLDLASAKLATQPVLSESFFQRISQRSSPCKFQQGLLKRS